MKQGRWFGLGVLALTGVALLGGCGDAKSDADAAAKEKVATVALITDTNGVDDRSFNQSAWEGMVAWGEKHQLKQGNEGYQYFQSSNESDYIPNIDQALNAGFQTIFGIGYKLKDAVKEQAQANPDKNFVIVDEVVEGETNVVSATFRSNEAAYLAGMAAAYTTKTGKVGFIGGVEVAVIQEFEAGYRAGVEAVEKELGKEITVSSQYAGAFDAPDKGRSISQAMYAKGADVIFAAAGSTGNGLFQEAKSLNESGKDKVWVIGVDRDQTEEGNYEVDGKKDTFTLTSTLKAVGETVQDLSEKANEGKFPGGEHVVYGLKEDGVGLTEGQLTEEVKQAIDEAKQAIIDGKITIPTTVE